MPRGEEKEIRTDNKRMLLCKAVQKENGDMELIKRDGKKEDTLTIASLLEQVYGRPVTIVLG